MSSVVTVLRLRDVRRIVLAWGLSVVGGSCSMIGFLVYAFVAGGAGLVAVYGVARVLPGAVVAPIVTGLGDRVPRDRLLRRTTALRAGLIAVAAVGVLVGAPAWIVIVAAALSASISSTYRPLQASTLPWLVRTPAELTAANVSATVMENSGSLLGPLLAGALLLVGGPASVLFASVGCMAGARLALRRLTVPQQPSEAGKGAGTVARDALAGADALRRIAAPCGVLVLVFAQTFARGALLVLAVVLVLGPLQLGTASVAWLNAASGIGGLVAGAAAAGLLRATRLGRSFVLGVALWGLPLLVLGMSQTTAIAYLAFVVVGVGNTAEDASMFSLLPRLLDHRIVGRAIGALELVIIAGTTAGSLAAPALAAHLGLGWALGLVGAALLVAVAVFWPAFARIDRQLPAPAPEVELLRGLPMFSHLPMVVVDQIASVLEKQWYEPGETVMREGEPGDRFYVVVAGSASVTVGGVHRSVLGPGDGMGEIALLRGVPRTATVVAVDRLHTVSVERDEFLAAVTGNQLSSASAHALATSRLAGDPLSGDPL